MAAKMANIVGDVTALRQRHHLKNIPHLVEKIKGFQLKAKSFRSTARYQNLWGGVLVPPLGVWICLCVRGLIKIIWGYSFTVSGFSDSSVLAWRFGGVNLRSIFQSIACASWKFGTNTAEIVIQEFRHDRPAVGGSVTISHCRKSSEDWRGFQMMKRQHCASLMGNSGHWPLYHR